MEGLLGFLQGFIKVR